MDRVLKHRRKIGILISVVAFLFLAGVAVTAFVSSDYVRMRLAGGFGEKLGREVAVDGPFNVNWAWGRTRVTAEQVRISNAAESQDPNMLEIEKLDMRIKVWPLLFGNIDVPEITLVKPRIVLEKYSAAANNWTFAPLSEAAALKETALPDNRAEVPKIGVLKITEGQLVYRDLPRKLDLDMRLDAVHGARLQGDTFGFEGKGTLDGKALDVKGEGGSLEMLRDTKADYPLRLEISMGGTKALLHGTFRDPVKLAGLDARMELSGTNLADLFHLTHIPLPPTPAYSLSGQLKKSGDVWKFEKFGGKVGNSDLSGDVKYDISGERPLLSGAVFSKRMDVDDLGGFIGYTKRDKPDPGRLLPDMPLDLARFRAADVDLTLKAKKLNAPGWPLTGMNLRFNLNNGLLKVDPLSFGVAGGNVGGSVTVDGRGEAPDVRLALDLKRLSVKQFLTSANLGDLSTGTFGGTIRLDGRGKTLADMLAVSNGRIILLMTGGRISLTVVEAADLDIAELVPLVLGKDKSTELRCAAGDFVVRKGRLNSRLFVIDTADTKFKGEASVNLKSERMDIELDAKPKDGSVLSLQSGVVVRGTFKDPDIGVDMGELGARGGVAAAAAIINPIAALVPFVEFGGGNDVNCQRLFERAKGPPQSSAR